MGVSPNEVRVVTPLLTQDRHRTLILAQSRYNSPVPLNTVLQEAAIKQMEIFCSWSETFLLFLA